MLTVRVKEDMWGFDGMKRRRGKSEEKEIAYGDVFQIRDKVLTNQDQIDNNVKEHKRLGIEGVDKTVMTAEQQFSPRWMEKVTPEEYVPPPQEEAVSMGDSFALSEANATTHSKKEAIGTTAPTDDGSMGDMPVVTSESTMPINPNTGKPFSANSKAYKDWSESQQKVDKEVI